MKWRVPNEPLTYFMSKSNGCQSSLTVFKPTKESTRLVKIRTFILETSTTSVPHYRSSVLCRVPTTHDKCPKPHDKPFVVRLRTANTTQQRGRRQRNYVVCNPADPRQSLCRVLQNAARQSKVGDDARTTTETIGVHPLQSVVSSTFGVRSSGLPHSAVCHAACFAVSLTHAPQRSVPCSSLCRASATHAPQRIVSWASLCRALCFAVGLSLPCACCPVDSVPCAPFAPARSAPRQRSLPGWQASDACLLSRVQAHGREYLVPLPYACTRQRPNFFPFFIEFTGIPAHQIENQYICIQSNSSGITTTYLHHTTINTQYITNLCIIDHW
jgi:hypothetical protein